LKTDLFFKSPLNVDEDDPVVSDCDDDSSFERERERERETMKKQGNKQKEASKEKKSSTSFFLQFESLFLSFVLLLLIGLSVIPSPLSHSISCRVS
jgi:hypothetical protein